MAVPPFDGQHDFFKGDGGLATESVLCCRAIYDQSYEDVGWHVGDNNGMPQHPQLPVSDLLQSIAQHGDPSEDPHDDPQDPTPSTSGRASSEISNADSDRSDAEKSSISSRVKSALRQAARMDSVSEAEQAHKDDRWRQNSTLQTIAPSSSSHKVGSQACSPLLTACAFHAGLCSEWQFFANQFLHATIRHMHIPHSMYMSLSQLQQSSQQATFHTFQLLIGQSIG